MTLCMRSPLRWLPILALETAFVTACVGDDPVPPGDPSSTSQGPGSSTSQPPPPATTTTGSPMLTTTSALDGTATAANDESETGSGIKLDVGGGQDGNDVELTGRVLSPSGVIPIPGALVYLTSQPPTGVPDQVYCYECEELTPQDFYTSTLPDGTFSLLANFQDLDTDTYLVVRKGHFLRITPITVQKGEQAVDEDLTRLPSVTDADNGRWIPKIAVYDTYPDEVQNVLAKFGLGQVNVSGSLVLGTEPFDFISDGDQGAFIDDLAQMSQYHIVFVPCAATKFWIGAPNVSDPRIENIRDYVAAGGRWYATDHSNEYVKEPFPAYLDLHSPAMPDIQPAYTVMGTVDDPGLLAWLLALPPELADIGGGEPTLGMLPQIELMNNFTGIDAVHEIIVQNDQGQDVNVGPHTYVSGPCTSCANPAMERSMAISGQYGCGRMMYSTFETSSSAHQGLNPQELVLLYMILEISVCQEDLVPPPQG
jgi:hypothetical protein